jgi:CRISPR system Cascade subunit CasC
VLQNFAPSCLNRDDVNTPKMCQFGGEPRARISSQSYKRAVREFFRDTNSVPVGPRTKRLQAILSDRLGDAVPPEKITAFLTECYSKMDGKRTDETAVLVFASAAEINEAEACLREGVAAKDAIPRLKAARKSADVALFGRMLAEKPDGNIDAACQVAHAISTHAVDLETDFYTAVDDLTQERNEIGAGMMGTQGFNSACFYRYAVVDREQLLKNLGGDRDLTERTIEAFLTAFCLAIPSAKQNSHAAQNLPSFGLFVARDGGSPISLANAFAQPVQGDLIGKSVELLCRYHSCMDRVYGLYDGATIALFQDREVNKHLGDLAAAEQPSLKKAVAQIMARVRP